MNGEKSPGGVWLTSLHGTVLKFDGLQGALGGLRVRVEDLEAKFGGIVQGVQHPHIKILQGDNTPRIPVFLVGKVVEAVVGEQKVALAPLVELGAKLVQKPVDFRVVEGVAGVIKPETFHQLQLLALEAVIQPPQEIVGEILASVDPAVVLDKPLLGNLLLDAGVVQVRVQHDQRERQHVGDI